MEREFRENDYVWAKMRGYPAWPAKVSKHPKGVKGPSNRLYVFFYGTHQYAWMSPSDLLPYSEYKSSLYKPCQRKGYSEAVWEIEEDPLLSITSSIKTPKRKGPAKKLAKAPKALSPQAPSKVSRKRKTPISPETSPSLTVESVKKERLDRECEVSECPLPATESSTEVPDSQPSSSQGFESKHRYATRRRNATDNKSTVEELQESYSARKEQLPLSSPSKGKSPPSLVLKGKTPSTSSSKGNSPTTSPQQQKKEVTPPKDKLAKRKQPPKKAKTAPTQATRRSTRAQSVQTIVSEKKLETEPLEKDRSSTSVVAGRDPNTVEIEQSTTAQQEAANEIAPSSGYHDNTKGVAKPMSKGQSSSGRCSARLRSKKQSEQQSSEQVTSPDQQQKEPVTVEEMTQDSTNVPVEVLEEQVQAAGKVLSAENDPVSVDASQKMPTEGENTVRDSDSKQDSVADDRQTDINNLATQCNDESDKIGLKEDKLGLAESGAMISVPMDTQCAVSDEVISASTNDLPPTVAELPVNVEELSGVETQLIEQTATSNGDDCLQLESGVEAQDTRTIEQADTCCPQPMETDDAVKECSTSVMDNSTQGKGQECATKGPAEVKGQEEATECHSEVKDQTGATKGPSEVKGQEPPISKVKGQGEPRSPDKTQLEISSEPVKVSPKALRPKRRIKNANISEDSPLKRFKVSAEAVAAESGKGSSKQKANSQKQAVETEIKGRLRKRPSVQVESGKGSSEKKATSAQVENEVAGKGEMVDGGDTKQLDVGVSTGEASLPKEQSEDGSKEQEKDVVKVSSLPDLPPFIMPQPGMSAVQILETYNYNLKAALTIEAPNPKRAVEILKDLNDLYCLADDVDKVPDIVATLKKLKRYKACPQVMEKSEQVFQKLKRLFLYPYPPPKPSQRRLKTASKLPKKAPIMADYIKAQNNLAKRTPSSQQSGVTNVIANKPSAKQLKTVNTPVVPDVQDKPVRQDKPVSQDVENQETEQAEPTRSTRSSARSSQRVKYDNMCPNSSATESEVEKNDQMVPT